MNGVSIEFILGLLATVISGLGSLYLSSLKKELEMKDKRIKHLEDEEHKQALGIQEVTLTQDKHKEWIRDNRRGLTGLDNQSDKLHNNLNELFAQLRELKKDQTIETERIQAHVNKNERRLEKIYKQLGLTPSISDVRSPTTSKIMIEKDTDF